MLKVVHQSGKTETSAFYRFFILKKSSIDIFISKSFVTLTNVHDLDKILKNCNKTHVPVDY